MQTKVCLQCLEIFSKPYNESQKNWDNRHKYCSKECSNLAKIGIKHSLEHIEKIRSTSIGRKHSPESILNMSGENSHRWKGGKPLCIDCGIRIKNVYAKRCLNCLKIYSKGKNAPNWQGGITPINTAIRNSIEYAEWRTAIFERDNYTCQECSVKGTTLHADHIKSFAYFPELRLDINNGRTLCVNCHRKTPNYGGKAKYCDKYINI